MFYNMVNRILMFKVRKYIYKDTEKILKTIKQKSRFNRDFAKKHC